MNKGLMLEGDIGGFRYTPVRNRRRLSRHRDGRNESLLETRSRVALHAAGLPVQPQVRIPGMGRVDLLIGGKVVVETDGRATHGLVAAFADDRRRDRAALPAGYPVMRFGCSHAMGDLVGLVEQVMAVVRKTPVAPL